MENKGKKILYVASNMRHINNFHLDYIKALRDSGDEVVVMARGDDADINIPFEKKLFSPKNTACRKMIRQAVENGGFDAIFLNTSLAAFHVRFALRGKRRPRIVNMVHGYLFSREVGFLRRTLLSLCERIVKSKTDAIITMNSEDTEIAKSKKLTRGTVYTSLGMGATLRPCITSPDAIRAEFCGEGRLVLCFVGELSGRKNQEFLIRAHKELAERITGAMLWLVGDGAEHDRLSDLVLELGLNDSVILVGQRSDACDFIRAADVYVTASQIEGMPFNVIEALGAKKTVIASRVKGHTDLIEHGTDGYLYDFRDTGAYLSLVEQVYRDGGVDPEAAYEKYKKYERSAVFESTLATIKEALYG